MVTPDSGRLAQNLYHQGRRKSSAGQRLMDLREERRVLADQVGNPNTAPAQKRLELECQKLQAILDSAIIAEPPSDQEKVALGAWVHLRDEEGSEETHQTKPGADEGTAIPAERRNQFGNIPPARVHSDEAGWRESAFSNSRIC